MLSGRITIVAAQDMAVDFSDAAASIGALLTMLRKGEMTAPQGVIDRLEGAFLTLTALDEGRCPTVEDFYRND